MNRAVEELFASLVTEDNVNDLVKAGREEGLYLEFKEKHDRRNGDLHDDDRRNFSKVVSGFANAAGGILIFGVATKKTDGIDRASALKPITGLERFRANLMNSILNTTEPPVDEVRIEAIPAGEHGYVKCLIGQSLRPPHRAMLADREYWLRISTGHRKMEHYELEDVFGRRLRPVLNLATELRQRPGDDPNEELHFFFVNEGRGVSKHSGLLCWIEGVTITQTNVVHNRTSINKGVPTVEFYDPHSVIHPNGVWASLGFVTFTRPNKGAELPIRVMWYAEDMQTRNRNLVVTPGPPALAPPERP